jgi:hypothetical protein
MFTDQAEQDQAEQNLDLDTSLLDSFKALEEPYNEFYNEPVTHINAWLLYVDQENNLDFINTVTHELSEINKLNKNELIALIKKHQIRNSEKYKLDALIWYNLDLSPNEINDYLSKDEPNNRFFHSEKKLNDVYFGATIKMFQDLNTVIILFRTHTSTHKHTKRIRLISNAKTKKHSSLLQIKKT